MVTAAVERDDRARPRRLVLRAVPRPRAGSMASSIRLGLLLLACLLTLLPGPDRAALPYLGGVLAFAAIGSRLGSGRQRTLLLVGEAFAAASGIAITGVGTSALLVCLPATGIAAGVVAGYTGAVLVAGCQAATLLVGRIAHSSSPVTAQGLTRSAAEWVTVALTFGLLTARIESTPVRDGPQERYVEAYRLLAQLRAVTRRLPGSLDPGTVADTLLAACVEQAGCEHGSVLLNLGGEQLVPLSLHGYRRVPWRADLSQDGPLQRAWRSGLPVVDSRQADTDGQRRGSVLLVLPVVVEGIRIGLVALESREPDRFGLAAQSTLTDLVAQYALPLETAALFDELRIGAAAEERARLAREMHDGIAQDLAFLGYELDGLTASLKAAPGVEPVEQQARALRRRITELIGDLRLSITDLRSSTGPARGLGAALSEYTRSVGTSSRITVHLSLTEGSTRLPADTEVQLLRIAHEAIARARRRPGVTNLWVTLTVDPPAATLVVEDDGRNAEGSSRDDQSGQQVMSERATRLGAVLLIQARQPIGLQTVVVLGRSADEHENDHPAGG